jgi:hypothetical protein
MGHGAGGFGRCVVSVSVALAVRGADPDRGRIVLSSVVSVRRRTVGLICDIDICRKFLVRSRWRCEKYMDKKITHFSSARKFLSIFLASGAP